VAVEVALAELYETDDDDVLVPSALEETATLPEFVGPTLELELDDVG